MRSSKIGFISLLFSTVFLISGMVRPQAAESLTSYIDKHNRFILNGEPFFPIGLYVVECSTQVDHSVELNEIANSPFDTLMNYGINRCDIYATDDQINSYLAQLESRNLKLIFSLWDYFADCEDTDNLKDTVINTIRHKVSTFKDRPAVISWYIQEERPPGACLPELEAGYAAIKALDKKHPVWSVIDGWPLWNFGWLTRLSHTTDIVGVDPYPIPFCPITDVSKMADVAKNTGKPLWLVPQMFSWGDYGKSGGRYPTKAEMRAMTYLAVNHGAKGLIYYSYFNIRDDLDYKTRWKEIKEIAGEIKRLRPVLLSTHQTNDNNISCNNGNIDFKLMREGDTYYLFAVNTKKKSINRVSFQCNPAISPSVIRLLFEDERKIFTSNDKFTDNFGPYEVHVYHWGDNLYPAHFLHPAKGWTDGFHLPSSPGK